MEKACPQRSYGPTLINDFALDFITRHSLAKAGRKDAAEAPGNDQPFFLYCPMILTHDPFQPTPDSPDWDPTTNDENQLKDLKHFADMTAYMDKMVGRIVAKLE